MTAKKPLSSADIDALCDRFEAECKQGGAPRIEQFLAGLAEEDHEPLLRELLFIDHDYRIRRGEPVQGEDYYKRFPGYGYIVDEVLHRGMGHDCETQLHTGSQKTSIGHAENQKPDSFRTLLEALPAADDPEAAGPVLDDYELLDELGRGGMGIVFRARQISVGRLVALKVLRRDKLSELPKDAQDTMIERFRTESQSAAQLEHDHIVPVYEVGEADGVHFYSMRYVQGESLADLMAQHPLDNHSAAEALEPIGRALQAAHERGVLHRDIKPRNIMIDDATGRPMLTDFGLAKLLEGASDMTHTGDVMGSPPYMSPEQASDAAHVTEAADVYSLGATLYHALTGRPPFQAATMAETLRQVWFDDPPPPRQLNPAIDRDLETICMKCLEKEPARRFSSAGELADELARFLRGEPIRSRPIGTLGQLQRWRRRNPVVAHLAGAVVTLVLLLLVGGIYYTIQLRKSLADAKVRLGWAVSAVDQMTDIATKEDGLKAHGVDDVRREMLSASRRYYDRFVERETNDPLLETERAKAYGRLANIEADLGNQQNAIHLYKQAVDVFAGLKRKYPSDPNYSYLQAAYLTNLATLYRDLGRFDDALASLGEAYDLAGSLHEKHPTDIEYADLLGQIHNERGVIYMDLGEIEKAELARLETVNLRRQIVAADDAPEYRHQLADGHYNLAEFYRKSGQPDKAVEHYARAAEIGEKLVQDHPRVSEYASGLALCEYSRGLMHLNNGHLDEAEALLMSALGRRYRLEEKHRQQPDVRYDLAASLDSMAQLLHERGEFDRAAGEYREALAIREELRNKYPKIPKYARAYAASQTNLGNLYRDRGLYQEAAGSYRIALDVLSQVDRPNADVATTDAEQANVHYNLALVLSLNAELSEAAEHAQAAIELQQKLAEDNASAAHYRAALADSYGLLAVIQKGRGQLEASAKTYEKLLAVRQQLAADNASPQNALQLASAYLKLAAARNALGEFDAAAKIASGAIETLQSATSAAENSDAIVRLLRQAYFLRVELYGKLGEHQLAVADWDQVIDVDPQPLYRLRRAVSLARGGAHAQAAGTLAEMPALSGETAGPELLWNAACVLSRAAEAAERDSGLDGQQRAEVVENYLQRGHDFVRRCLQSAGDQRAALADQLRQDGDLARLREHEPVKKLLAQAEDPAA